MNYYIPKMNQKLYLYNKATHTITNTFLNEDELEKWMELNLRRIGNDWFGLATQLSMNINELIPEYGRHLNFGNDGKIFYTYTEEIVGYKKQYIILTNFKAADEYSVYNYTYLVEKVKNKIINGECSANYYAKWWGVKKKNLPEFRKGPIPHTSCRKNSGTRANLIVNRSERASFDRDIDDSYYNKDTDEFIKYELPRNIKTSRGRRRELTAPWEDGYCRRSNHDKWKTHQSWKRQKKSRQWM